MSHLKASDALPDNWSMYYAQNGKPYFHNKLTGATQWTKPSLDTDVSENPNEFKHEDITNASQVLKDMSFVDITNEEFDSQFKLEPKPLYLSNPTESASPTANSAPLTFFFINISFMQKFFNITSQQVFQRIYNVFTLNNFNLSPTYTIYQKDPDLYGPFWIATTLIMLLFACENLNIYFFDNTKKPYYFVLTAGYWIIYSYIYALPLCLWLAVKVFGSEEEINIISIVELICLYGYSQIICFPIALTFLCNFRAIHFMACIVGIVYSCCFYISSILPKLRVAKLKVIIMALIVISQSIFYFIIPLYFFKTVKAT